MSEIGFPEYKANRDTVSEMRTCVVNGLAYNAFMLAGPALDFGEPMTCDESTFVLSLNYYPPGVLRSYAVYEQKDGPVPFDEGVDRAFQEVIHRDNSETLVDMIAPTERVVPIVEFTRHASRKGSLLSVEQIAVLEEHKAFMAGVAIYAAFGRYTIMAKTPGFMWPSHTIRMMAEGLKR